MVDGADAVELDLRLAADGELVVFHDDSLDRLAGRPGSVELSTLGELRSVRLQGPADRGPRLIPTLDEVLAALPPGLPVNLEVKVAPTVDRARFVDRLVAALARHGDRPGVLLVSSFDEPFLVALRRAAPDAALAVLDAAPGPAMLTAATRLGAVALALADRNADPPLLAAAAAAGFATLVYTVNDPAVAERLFAAGASAVFTDVPGRLRRAGAVSRHRPGAPRQSEHDAAPRSAVRSCPP